jgi:hypothetical protein
VEPGGALQGLACRQDGVCGARSAAGLFRPASREDPLIGERLERLGAGLAQSEAEAARRGWL